MIAALLLCADLPRPRAAGFVETAINGAIAWARNRDLLIGCILAAGCLLLADANAMIGTASVALLLFGVVLLASVSPSSAPWQSSYQPMMHPRVTSPLQIGLVVLVAGLVVGAARGPDGVRLLPLAGSAAILLSLAGRDAMGVRMTRTELRFGSIGRLFRSVCFALAATLVVGHGLLLWLRPDLIALLAPLVGASLLIIAALVSLYLLRFYYSVRVAADDATLLQLAEDDDVRPERGAMDVLRRLGR